MVSISNEDFLKAIRNIGLKEGDTVFLHSDLRIFGFPEGTTSRDEVLKFYYNGFRRVLGVKSGTLAVPAYFYEYARYGEPFDVDRSPVSAPLGVFSSYIVSMQGRVRSCNPLQSIAAIGGQAEELCGGNSVSGYGATSPWHKLRMMKGKIVFLGVSVQPMTYVHYIEQQFGVPHLYFKVYPYPIIKNGKPLPGYPISAVRFLEFGIEYDLMPFENELNKRGVLKSEYLGLGKIMVVDAEDAYQIGIELLDKNPYFFLKKPPAFVPGKIPTDGTTGKPKKTG